MSANKRKVKNKKANNTTKMVIVLITIFVFSYIIYKIVNLIAVPTDAFIIEKGTISNEENAVRICYKR